MMERIYGDKTSVGATPERNQGEDCQLNKAGKQLVDGLHRYGDGQPITRGKVVAPDRYMPAFGALTLHELRAAEAGPGEEPVMEARLPVNADWYGLKMIGIESRLINFSDSWSLSIHI